MVGSANRIRTLPPLEDRACPNQNQVVIEDSALLVVIKGWFLTERRADAVSRIAVKMHSVECTRIDD